MNDIITISFNAAELCGLVVSLLLFGVVLYLMVKEHVLDSKSRFITRS